MASKDENMSIDKGRQMVGLKPLESEKLRKCLKCRKEFMTVMAIRTCGKCNNGDTLAADHKIRIG